MKKICIRAFISGRVQGVFYRDWTKRAAEQFGVKGWVRNFSDGQVEAFLEGEEGAVTALVNAFSEGSEFSQVTGVEAREEPYLAQHDTFSIRY